MITLETERLILRPYTLNDLDFYSSLWVDPEVVRFIGAGVTRDRKEAAERLRRLVKGYDSGYGLLALSLKSTQRLVGHAGLVQQEVDGRLEIELGYWLARDYWGQGLATESSLTLRDYAFDVLRLKRIISIIQPANQASIAVATRVGLHHERDAVFRGIHVSIYSTEQEYPPVH